MPPRPSLEDRLARLSELRAESDPETVRRELKKALTHRSPHLVAKTAALIAELGRDELAPELAAAFDRFMKDPVRRDKGCVAKTAIATALVELEEPQDAVYLTGVRHRQNEPAWGGSVDTAVALRARCAEGLLVAGHPDLVLEMADLLVDPETHARAAAARVLGASGRPAAEPLLRLKVRMGDREGEVTGEAFAGLLATAPKRSLPLADELLRSDDPSVVEAVAMALGESRRDEALAILRRRYESCDERRLRQTLLLAVSVLRREPALSFLLSLVERAGHDDAGQALIALAIHRGDDAVRERVETALAGRPDAADLQPVFDRGRR